VNISEAFELARVYSKGFQQPHEVEHHHAPPLEWRSRSTEEVTNLPKAPGWWAIKPGFNHRQSCSEPRLCLTLWTTSGWLSFLAFITTASSRSLFLDPPHPSHPYFTHHVASRVTLENQSSDHSFSAGRALRPTESGSVWILSSPPQDHSYPPSHQPCSLNPVALWDMPPSVSSHCVLLLLERASLPSLSGRDILILPMCPSDTAPSPTNCSSHWGHLVD
jgi:hypothetical protein